MFYGVRNITLNSNDMNRKRNYYTNKQCSLTKDHTQSHTIFIANCETYAHIHTHTGASTKTIAHTQTGSFVDSTNDLHILIWFVHVHINIYASYI